MAEEAIRVVLVRGGSDQEELGIILRVNSYHEISDRKWALKKRQIIAHIKARSKHSSLTLALKKRPIMPNLACGRVPRPVCFNAGFIALVECGIVGLCFTCGACNRDVMIGGRVPCQVPWWAWQEVKGEPMAVDETDYTSVM